MGYLSQKKKSIREHNFFMFSAVVLSVLSLLSLFSDNFPSLKDRMFLLYLLNIVLFFYTLIRLQFKFVLLFLVLVLINFFSISAYSRIFFNKNHLHSSDILISYDGSSLTPKGSDDIKWLYFDSENKASYSEMTIEDNNFNLLMLNFDDLSSKQRKKNLIKLKNFILSQDLPTIVIGDFGTSVWQPEMRKFLEQTNLKTLNRLVFAKKGSSGNYLNVPSFYVLAFEDFGLSEIKISEIKSTKYPIINISLHIKKD